MAILGIKTWKMDNFAQIRIKEGPTTRQGLKLMKSWL